MNFISGFVLEVSGFKEFETFDFLIQFLKSPSRLFIGLYEDSFPMLGFLTFMFDKLLQMMDKERYQQVLKCGIPKEMWLVKWLLTLYTGYFTKQFLLRIWDYLVIEDYMGPVFVALVIVLITKKQLFVSFEKTIMRIQNTEKLCSLIDFRKFIKKLQKIKISVKRQKELLNEYFLGLKNEAKSKFEDIYKRLMFYLNQKEKQKKKCKYFI
jgi:hypothetical protein